MTNNEAIGILAIVVETAKGRCFVTDEAISDAYAVAIKAIEKQIPKEVRITTSTKRCSVCGRQLSGIGNIHPKINYCQGCGQAIDWENK